MYRYRGRVRPDYLSERRRDYYSENLSILDISSYSDCNLIWDARILKQWKIMRLFKL